MLSGKNHNHNEKTIPPRQFSFFERVCVCGHHVNQEVVALRIGGKFSVQSATE